MIVLEGVLGRCRLFDVTCNQAFFFSGKGEIRRTGKGQGNLSPPKDTRKKEGLIAGYVCCHIGK